MTQYTDMLFSWPEYQDAPIKTVQHIAIGLQKFLEDNFGISANIELREDGIVMVALSEDIRHIF